jgi:hypothetical protein
MSITTISDWACDYWGDRWKSFRRFGKQHVARCRILRLAHVVLRCARGMGGVRGQSRGWRGREAPNMEVEDGVARCNVKLWNPLFTSLPNGRGRYSRARGLEHAVPRRHANDRGLAQPGLRIGVGPVWVRSQRLFSTYLSRVFPSPCRPYTCVGVVG